MHNYFFLNLKFCLKLLQAKYLILQRETKLIYLKINYHALISTVLSPKLFIICYLNFICIYFNFCTI